jgi:hypothetical protein
VIILAFTAALVLPILWGVLVAAWDILATSTAAVGSGIATAWAFLTTSGLEVAAVEATEASEVAVASAATTATKEVAETGEVAALNAEAAALSAFQAPLFFRREIAFF